MYGFGAMCVITGFLLVNIASKQELDENSNESTEKLEENQSFLHSQSRRSSIGSIQNQIYST